MLTKSEIKANRQKWYDELMSGNHTQTKFVLHDHVGKCCLGVACVVAEREGITEKRDVPSGENYIYYGDKYNTLPDEVACWLGFSDEVACWLGFSDDDNDMRPSDPRTEEGGIVRGRSGNLSFSELNDQEGKSFEQIAAILKRDFIDTMEEENVDS